MSEIVLYEGIVAELDGLGFDRADSSTDTIKTVAMWRNQPARENKENPFLYPAVFIEFLPSDFMEGSSKVFQQVNMTVRLHICVESYKTEDLDIILLKQRIYSTLQLKQWGTWGVMKRRGEDKNFDHDHIEDYIQDYDCGRAKDYGADARPTTDATIDSIDLDVTINKELE